MKIGPQDKPGLPDVATPGTRADNRLGGDTRAALMRASGVATALGAATGGGTEVKLSAAATGVLGAVGATTADVDMAKVRQMQAALASGSYRVNPDAIADELIASAQSFLPKR